MTKNLDSAGLRSIVENYDLFFVDLWGVVHNGIKLNKNDFIWLLILALFGLF